MVLTARRRAVAAIVAASVLGGGGVATARLSPAAPVAAPRDTAVRYAPPAPLRVVRGFEQPAGPYGPGHRGVDLAAASGDPVRAAAVGSVTFAGSVAGRGVVVVQHADGVRTEYEPVRPAVRAGAVVVRGQALGVVAGRHASCAPSTCLHWGARRGAVYLDPLTLLRPLGPVRLLPWRRGG